MPKSTCDGAAAGLSFGYSDEIEYDPMPDLLAEFPDRPTGEADETWDYMVDLLEAHEISFNEFRRQMLSVGYSEGEIEAARRVDIDEEGSA